MATIHYYRTVIRPDRAYTKLYEITNSGLIPTDLVQGGEGEMEEEDEIIHVHELVDKTTYPWTFELIEHYPALNVLPIVRPNKKILSLEQNPRNDETNP